MNARAIILFICVVVYIVETSQIGYKNCTSPAPIAIAEKSCCSSKKQCPKGEAGQPTEQKKDNGCKDMANCSNCPVCYTAIFPVNNLPSNVMSFLKRQYPVIQITYNALYHGESWKPPDVVS